MEKTIEITKVKGKEKGRRENLCMEERVLRTLSIKAFHVREAVVGDRFSLSKGEANEYSLQYNPAVLEEFAKEESLIIFMMYSGSSSDGHYHVL